MKKEITASSLQYFNYIVIFFMLLFTASDEDINIPYISVSVGITFPAEIALLCACLFITVLYDRRNNESNNRIDLILFALLFIRVIMFTVGYYSRSNSGDNVTRYMAVFLWPILYLLTSYQEHTKSAVNRIIKLAEVATIIISIQAIASSIIALTSGIYINYVKNYIRIPLAPSNTITCYLILMIPFIYFLGTGLYRNIALLLCLISIILTRSFSGLVTVAVFFLFLLFRHDKKNFLRVIIAIVTLIVAIVIINRVDPVFFERYVNRLNLLMSSNSSARSESLNGRDTVYRDAVYLIKKNFPFGLGVSYSEFMNNKLAHNWVLETFLQEGLLNFLIVVSIFIISLVRLIRAKNTFCKAGAISLIMVLIQASVEPSITAFPFDTFLWIFLGSTLCFSNESNMDELPD